MKIPTFYCVWHQNKIYLDKSLLEENLYIVMVNQVKDNPVELEKEHMVLVSSEIYSLIKRTGLFPLPNHNGIFPETFLGQGM